MFSVNIEIFENLCTKKRDLTFNFLFGFMFAELRKARTDLSAFQKQAEGVNVEYDRLLQEHSKLQVRRQSQYY